MQGGRGRRDGFFGFGDPFPGLGSFGQPGSLLPSFFGGANPFDDPFFTNPFGAMMGPSLLQPSMFGTFGSNMFGPHGNFNGASNPRGFLQQTPEPSRPRGPIIKELSSDDEDGAGMDKEDEKKTDNPRKHPRMGQVPYVEVPDEDTEDNKRPKHNQFGRGYARASTSHPQPQTFIFQSSTVTYGGPNGACYTSSATRRTGGDGITLEERKEADTTTGRATHRISRGIGNKGHSLTRKLSSDGNVGTMQTLHNLNEDDLAGFEESWQRNAGQHLSGWDPRVNMLGSGTSRSGIQDENHMLALPAPGQSHGTSSNRMKRPSQNASSKGTFSHT
uniref:Glycine-rich protein n=1 Tax=Leersia perrieri TaxID=77586 RepID=A0A0D9X3W6_9ORYZ